MGAVETAAGCACALSTSALTIRPLGPDPLIRLRSRPLSAAIRRASGDANMRLPAELAAGAAGGGLAAGAGSALAGAGARASVTGAGGAGSAVAVTEPMSASLSPSARRTAMGELTFTLSVPSGTRIRPTVPSSTASNSIVALSVSISASRSPADTVSPSVTSHFASVPSSMVGERAGMRTSVGILPSPYL